MKESKYWYLVGKSISKLLTEEEENELNNWIAINDPNKKQFQKDTRIWKSFEAEHPEIDFDTPGSWFEIKSRIDNELHQKKYKTLSLVIWRSIAAASILVIIFFSSWLLFRQGSRTIELVTFETREKFILPDSSQLWLNKNSVLTYNSDFGTKCRKVHLTGEAYFEVKHDVGKPFIIHSGQAQTKVLGTKFNVRNYVSDSTIVVSVFQGKVQFRADTESNSLILTKNHSGSFNKETGLLQESITKNPNIIAWQTGRLTFASSSMQYLINQLESYYNIRIQLLSPEIKAYTFSGSFNNQSLNEVLEILEYTLNISFVGTGINSYSVKSIAAHN